MSDQNKSKVTLEELHAQVEILQEAVVNLEQENEQLKAQANNSLAISAKKEKAAPLVPGEFTNNKKKYRFKQPKIRFTTKRGRHVFMATADLVKDEELLAEVVERFPNLFSEAK